jgi:hypothetical protein
MDCPITFFGGPSDGATIIRPIRAGYRVWYSCNSRCVSGVTHAHPEWAHYTAIAWYELDKVPVSILAMIDDVTDFNYP